MALNSISSNPGFNPLQFQFGGGSTSPLGGSNPMLDGFDPSGESDDGDSLSPELLQALQSLNGGGGPPASVQQELEDGQIKPPGENGSAPAGAPQQVQNRISQAMRHHGQHGAQGSPGAGGSQGPPQWVRQAIASGQMQPPGGGFQ